MRAGALFGQAAHIPVHLGSMAYAMADIVRRFEWRDGDLVLLNDPFLGGTHLPDVTAVCPIFDDGVLVGFAACRAHHANIGSDRPGSMPVSTIARRRRNRDIADARAARRRTHRVRPRTVRWARRSHARFCRGVSRRRASRRLLRADECVPPRRASRRSAGTTNDCSRVRSSGRRPERLRRSIGAQRHRGDPRRRVSVRRPDGRRRGRHERCRDTRARCASMATVARPTSQAHRPRFAATSIVRCRSPRPRCFTYFVVSCRLIRRR